MTKEEAIKYLQQLYPNGGHCWLDEQRIEAIGMAVKALQEEPVSEDLEKAAVEAFKQIVDSGKNNFLEIFKAGANWKKEHLWKPAYGDDLPKTDGWTIVLTECKAPWIAHDEEKPFYSVDLARWSKYIKGWNTSDVKWWMDCLLPNLGED